MQVISVDEAPKVLLRESNISSVWWAEAPPGSLIASGEKRCRGVIVESLKPSLAREEAEARLDAARRCLGLHSAKPKPLVLAVDTIARSIVVLPLFPSSPQNASQFVLGSQLGERARATLGVLSLSAFAALANEWASVVASCCAALRGTSARLVVDPDQLWMASGGGLQCSPTRFDSALDAFELDWHYAHLPRYRSVIQGDRRGSHDTSTVLDFAVSLTAVLLGKIPWEISSETSVEQIAEAYRSWSKGARGVDWQALEDTASGRSVVAILERSMSFAPSARPESVGAVAAALTAAVEEPFRGQVYSYFAAFGPSVRNPVEQARFASDPCVAPLPSETLAPRAPREVHEALVSVARLGSREELEYAARPFGANKTRYMDDASAEVVLRIRAGAGRDWEKLQEALEHTAAHFRFELLVDCFAKDTHRDWGDSHDTYDERSEGPLAFVRVSLEAMRAAISTERLTVSFSGTRAYPNPERLEQALTRSLESQGFLVRLLAAGSLEIAPFHLWREPVDPN